MPVVASASDPGSQPYALKLVRAGFDQTNIAMLERIVLMRVPAVDPVMAALQSALVTTVAGRKFSPANKMSVVTPI